MTQRELAQLLGNEDGQRQNTTGTWLRSGRLRPSRGRSSRRVGRSRNEPTTSQNEAVGQNAEHLMLHPILWLIKPHLPTYSRRTLGEGEEAEFCTICISEIEVGTEIAVTSCHHTFHVTCLKQWLQINTICPLCRTRCYDLVTFVQRI